MGTFNFNPTNIYIVDKNRNLCIRLDEVTSATINLNYDDINNLYADFHGFATGSPPYEPHEIHEISDTEFERILFEGGE